MKKLIFSICIFFSFAINAHTVDVRILSTMSVTTVNVSVHTGTYLLYLDGKPQPDSLTTKVFQLIEINDSIEVRIPGDTIGRFVSFRIVALEDSSVFKIKPIKPFSGTRIYDHSLLITVVNGFLQCINSVALDHYVAGVVESEAGGRTSKEFYKVQAILCRTYALAHLYRHVTEGFDVCDGVHCQAYRGRPSDLNVLSAVKETEGLVIVDQNLILITPAFFSNCGGQTANSEDVWSVSVPYLRSVKDTFCLHSTNATWKRKIAKEDWLSYLASKHKYPINDSLACYNAMNMTQSTRGASYCYAGVKIPYKTIRADWQLRSAYFSIEEAKDSIIIRGRGYGHGVGLCQEGAIRMAKLGYSYEWILNYYYKNVEIINLSKLEFFKEE
ncbi:MAG: SpoIID/LytB domain-containing protein [Bacteroidetes bacterium]|jgi:stage II sporulation protein D|nr:SpoIID/LytB domain-containing protein [Bacteroidota bacterium]